MIDAVHFRDAIGLEAGEDERGACAEVARHHGRAAQAFHAFDGRRVAVERDVRAHALQLADVHVALRKNRLADDADAARAAQQRAHLRLHVGRESGVGLGGEAQRLRVAVAAHGDRIRGGLHLVAALADVRDHVRKMLRFHAQQFHLGAHHRACDEIRAGLDAVGDDAVLRAVQFLHALDDDAPRARALDLCAHLVQEIREVHDLGFGSRALDHGDAFRERGGHHHVVGAEHGRAVFPEEVHLRAA